MLNTTADNNTAVGKESLTANTTGCQICSWLVMCFSKLTQQV